MAKLRIAHFVGFAHSKGPIIWALIFECKRETAIIFYSAANASGGNHMYLQKCVQLRYLIACIFLLKLHVS